MFEGQITMEYIIYIYIYIIYIYIIVELRTLAMP